MSCNAVDHNVKCGFAEMNFTQAVLNVMRRVLTVAGVLAGFFGIVFGLSCAWVAVFNKEVELPPAIGILIGVFISALGVGSIFLSVSKWSARSEGPAARSRLLARILLRGFGLLAVLFALGGVGWAVDATPGRSRGVLWFGLLFLWIILPFAFGCWLIGEAQNHYGPGERSMIDIDTGWVFKAGRGALILLMISLAIARPLPGFICLALLVVLTFAAQYYVRSRPKLKGGGVMTPLGRLDAAKAKVLEGVAEDLAGWLLAALELTLEIVLAALTGGESGGGFSGGGGSSGGAGASGDY